MKLGVAIVRLWIILLSAVLAKSGGTHCTASLVGNFATRPVTLNTFTKVLYPTISVSSKSIAKTVKAILPSLVSQILDFSSQ
jgi:signal transduction protein with GAF and PtsI domain